MADASEVRLHMDAAMETENPEPESANLPQSNAITKLREG